MTRFFPGHPLREDQEHYRVYRDNGQIKSFKVHRACPCIPCCCYSRRRSPSEAGSHCRQHLDRRQATRHQSRIPRARSIFESGWLFWFWARPALIEHTASISPRQWFTICRIRGTCQQEFSRRYSEALPRSPCAVTPAPLRGARSTRRRPRRIGNRSGPGARNATRHCLPSRA